MKYLVKGAHAETAEDVEVLIEAETEKDAAATVAGMQVMVERAEEIATSLDLHMSMIYEYHTLRCDFRDLTTHLNKYGREGWKLFTAHHDPHDDKMVRCIMERPSERQ